MKKVSVILVVAVIGVLFSSCFSFKPAEPLPMEYSEVINVEGTKDELYTKANIVFVELFYSSKSVIQFQDPEVGVIKGKYVSDIKYTDGSFLGGTWFYTARSTVQVDLKDNAYRITFRLNEVVQTAYSDPINGRSLMNNSIDGNIPVVIEDWKEMAKTFKTRMSESNNW